MSNVIEEEPRKDTAENGLNPFMEKLLNLSADQAGGASVEWKALGEVA